MTVPMNRLTISLQARPSNILGDNDFVSFGLHGHAYGAYDSRTIRPVQS